MFLVGTLKEHHKGNIACLLIKSIRPHPKGLAVMIHPSNSQFSNINDVFDAVFSAPKPVSALPVTPSEGQALDNRGATFPNIEKTENNDLRKFISERWKLKHEVVGILRKPENKRRRFVLCCLWLWLRCCFQK